jgi:Family of unknown function (DUF5996)
MQASLTLEPLPYEVWEPTKTTLHLWCQIIGKIALRSTALRNHWWNMTFVPRPHGPATRLLRNGGRFFEIELDLLEHAVVVRAHDVREPATFPLYDGLSVAEFFANLKAALASLGIVVPILARPYGVPYATPFTRDREHHAYDATAVRRWWNIILWSTGVFEDFASSFVGKQGPVQLFWHSFDLALGRYSGARAPGPPKDDPVAQEAYSHEVIAFGFWPGDPNTPAPTYYTYTAPEPATLADQPLAPAGAAWGAAGNGHLGTLAYETVRTSPDPARALTEFLVSAYDAGTRAAGWDTASFAHDRPGEGGATDVQRG